MLQCCRGLDLDHETLCTQHGSQLRLQYLERDLAVVLDILGEIDGGHSPLTELAYNSVSVGNRGGETLESDGSECRICHWRQTCGTPVVTSMATLAGDAAGGAIGHRRPPR